jgi:Skp family chaperone for outer membrane proteins
MDGVTLRRCIIIAAVIMFMQGSGLSAAELKVGHFDLQRLIAHSDAGKEAREKYLSRAKSYQDEINQRTERLKKMKEDIEGEAKKLRENAPPPAGLVEKDKEYAAQFRDFQRLLGGYQDELKVFEADLTRKVLEEFAPVLADYARSKHYDYIFRLNESFAFAGEKHDLTDELVKAFNKAHKK